MVLLWAVPAVCAVVAVAVVLSRLRTIEDVATDLAIAVGRSREVRRPLADLRHEIDRSRPVVGRVYAHWEQQDRQEKP
jgi:hypothetical protein